VNGDRVAQAFLIFGRTSAGEREITARELPLSQSARRILMLIDGKRSVRELSRLARPGELEGVLTMLDKHALIEPVATAAEATEVEQRALIQQERERLRRLKAALGQMFADRLDVAGHIWDARIADAVNDEVLRRVLREAIDTLERRRGSEVARKALEQARIAFRQE